MIASANAQHVDEVDRHQEQRGTLGNVESQSTMIEHRQSRAETGNGKVADMFGPKRRRPMWTFSRKFETGSEKGAIGLQRHRILDNLDEHGEDLVHLCWIRVLVLAIMAGSFIAFGGALSVVISEGDISPGPQKVLVSFGFTAGFGLVILSGAALYTEVNVALPVYLLVRKKNEREPLLLVLKVWFLVWFGNVLGSLLTASVLVGARVLTESQEAYLFEIAEHKLTECIKYGDAAAWFRVVLSAMLGNWMVGMAAYNAAAGQSIPGQLVGIFLPILAFVSLGLQHSPANMGYLHTALVSGIPSLSWTDVWVWNLIPASLGNLVGASVFVAVPFFYAFSKQTKPRNRKVIHRQAPV